MKIVPQPLRRHTVPGETVAFKSSSSSVTGAGVGGASAGTGAVTRGGGGWFPIWKTSLPSTVVANMF